MAEIIQENPELRRVVIAGLSRVGEILNIVAPSKKGKSWLVLMIVLCVVTRQAARHPIPSAHFAAVLAPRFSQRFQLKDSQHCESRPTPLPQRGNTRQPRATPWVAV